MSRRTLPARRRAAALVVALAALLLVALVGGQLMRSLVRSQRQSRQHHASLQALWLAEAGLARAASRLAADSTYAGETWRPVISDNSASGTSAVAGRVEIVVETGSVEASHR